MSFWTDLETSIAAEIKAVEAEIVKIATAIKPVVLASAQEVGQIAVQSVLAQAPALVSGQVKLNTAVENVVASVTASGKSILASTAETAVQTAYNMISASLAPKATN